MSIFYIYSIFCHIVYFINLSETEIYIIKTRIVNICKLIAILYGRIFLIIYRTQHRRLSMDKLNRLLNGTLAGQIAKKLDEADGKKDGKISASIWNSFVKDKGGKEIKQFINVYDAMNSITTYAVKESKKSTENKSINQMATDWLKAFDNKNDIPKDAKPEDVPQKAENIPQKDETPPSGADKETVKKINTPNKENAGKTITNPDGTKTKYDQNGFIIEIRDASGEEITTIDRDNNGKMSEWVDFVIDQNGTWTKSINRDDQGNVIRYEEYERDSAGKETRTIIRDAQGNVTRITDHDEDLIIYRDAQGNLTGYTEITRNSEGFPRAIHRDKNGKVLYYEEEDYDEKNQEIVTIRYNPDGTKAND